MSFVPKTQQDVAKRMIARLVGRTKLTDVADSSVAIHLVGAVSREIEDIYTQCLNLLNLMDINKMSGDDLDDLAGIVAPGGIPARTQATKASTMLTLTTLSASNVVVPRGFRASTSDGYVFETISEVTIPAGGSNQVEAQATNPGSDYNVAAYTITKIVSQYPGVDAVTNINAVTNGTDEETDDSLRGRILAYMRSLARSTPSALESLAATIGVTAHDPADAPTDRGTPVKYAEVDSYERRVKYAKLVEDPAMPGESVLYIDDGTGFAGLSSDMLYVEVTEPSVTAQDGQRRYQLQYWPLEPGTPISVEVKDGAITNTYGESDGFFTVNRSNGKVVFSSALSSTMEFSFTYTASCDLAWAVQYGVEGDESDVYNWPGWRAAGTKVYVRRPRTTFVDVAFTVSVSDGYNESDVKSDAVSAVTTYINSLGIGQNVLLSEIITAIMETDGVYNCQVSSPVTDVSVPDDTLPRAGSIG